MSHLISIPSQTWQKPVLWVAPLPPKNVACTRHFCPSFLEENSQAVCLFQLHRAMPGTAIYLLLSFVLSNSHATKRCQFSHCSKWGNTKICPLDSFKWPGGWTHAPLSLSLWGRSHRPGRTFSLGTELCRLGSGLMQGNWNCSSYLIPSGCSQLCICPGSCNFLTRFWNSHIDIVVHISLLNLCFCEETRAAGTTILPSWWCHS